MCLSYQKLINYLDNLYVCMGHDQGTKYCENEYIGENVIKDKTTHFIWSSGTL